jgi:hypothetical protein
MGLETVTYLEAARQEHRNIRFGFDYVLPWFFIGNAFVTLTMADTSGEFLGAALWTFASAPVLNYALTRAKESYLANPKQYLRERYAIAE